MYPAARFLCAFGLALIPCANLLAQPDPIRFGRVSAEDFELAPQQSDTNATAVVLVDYGKTSFESRGRVIFERHRRIKILTEAGFDWGTHDVVYRGGRDGQRVRGVRGETHMLQPDGEVVSQRLDRGSIFDEDIDGGLRRVRFTLPALAPGAIVEYRYTIESPHPGYAPDWAFQTTEPTLWSEYRFDVPDSYEYVLATIGEMNYTIQESTPSVRVGGRGMLHRWVMQDVPALREEPFTTTIKDHQARLRFQLSAMRMGGGARRPVLRTWGELAKELMTEYYGAHLRGTREVSRAAAEVVQDESGDFDKMVAIYDYVRRHIRFTGRLGFLPEKEPREVLRTGSGSSPEIALLLTAMLRSEGLVANPVLISTRAHGRILDVYPLYSQFNDVLVHVQIGDRRYLLDATDEHRPFDLLPPAALNERGWLVSERGQRWITIPASGLLARSVRIDATMDPTGVLTGQLAHLNDGYAAVELRTELASDFDQHRIVRENVFEGVDGVVVKEHSISASDSGDGQVAIDAEFVLPAFAQAAGDLMFFNPIIVGGTDANPFRLPERTYPVDFGFPRTHSYELRLTLPEGYTVLDPPQNRLLRPSRGGATYRRVVTMDDGALVVQTQLQVSRVIFQPAEYADLREFFAQMIATEAEQIVLTRAPGEADGPTREVVGGN